MKILHERGVYLTRDDFTSVSNVTRLKNANIQLKGTAIVEPKTGYFFSATLAGEVWKGAFAPGVTPAPQQYEERDWDGVLRRVEHWADWLEAELKTSQPWGDRAQIEDYQSVLFYRELEELYRGVKSAGAPMADIRLRVTKDYAQLEDSDSPGFKFNLRRVSTNWSVTFRPGDQATAESYTVGWNELLELLRPWTRYWMREKEVVFPSIDEPRESDHPQLLELRLNGIRGFRNFELPLSSPDGDKTRLLIGRNGTGKSTILRCIAIALADPADRASLLSDVPGGLLPSEGRGSIHVDARVAGELVSYGLEISSEGGRERILEQSNNEPRTYVYGYGSVFGVTGSRDTEDYSSEAVESLFKYDAKLFLPEMTLRRLKESFTDERYAGLLRRISDAMSLDGLVELQEGGGVLVKAAGRPDFFLPAWADGYKLTMHWILDLYGWAFLARVLEPGGPYGVLLIDEVEKHLHPSMQAALINGLKKSFPHLQMILTTHSPLVALGAEPENLVVLEQGSEGIEARVGARDYTGYTVADMYADPKLFDTEPYSPEVQELLEEYQRLLSGGLNTEEDRAVFEEVAQKLREVEAIDPSGPESG